MANPLSRTEMESNEGSVLCEPKRSSCFAMNLVFFRRRRRRHRRFTILCSHFSKPDLKQEIAEQNKISIFLKDVTIPAHFCLFSFFSNHNSNIH